MTHHFETMTAENTVIVDVTGKPIPGAAFDPSEYDRRYLMGLPTNNGAAYGVLHRVSDGAPVAVSPARGVGASIWTGSSWRQVIRFGPGTSEAFLFWAFAVSP